jgi:hypothetical protein
MHGAVLQNDDYIEFSYENTVEVISMGDLDRAIKAGEKKAGTYDATDEEGNPVKFMVEWPGVTAEDIAGMRASKAGTYNDTGGIQFTAIVNPHTEERMKAFGGSRPAKNVMEAVEEVKEKLEKKYGPSLSRKDIEKVDEMKAECAELLESKGAGKALGHLKKNEKKLKKKGDRIGELVDAYKAELMDAAGEELDEVDTLIDAGDISKAKKILAALKSPVRKTPLEARVNELYEKIKAQSADK